MTSRDMAILLLNAGSSSLKATLMDSASGEAVARGQADWAGDAARYQFSGQAAVERREEVSWKSHAKAVERFVADLTSGQRSSLAGVGHRVVHGGSFTTAVRITPEIRSRITDLADLAPLHNPPSLETLAAAEALLPSVPHVAVFDTAFHSALPPEASTYAVPRRWTRDWGIRRYGFHGLSHAYCARRAAEMLAEVSGVRGPESGVPGDSSTPDTGLRTKDPNASGVRGPGSGVTGQSSTPDTRHRTPDSACLVICHLGHGCSASAVQGGKCVDTSMGFTPLDGLMMATRSGSIDPSIVVHVQLHHGLTAAQVETALNRESGLLGVSGLSADMRQVLAAAKAGNEQASLALGIYTHRVRQAIGAFAVTMGGIDALVFTAGVGEHSAEVRAGICVGLDCLGLELDSGANNGCRPDADIAKNSSRGRILVIATREDVTMLHEVIGVVGA